MTERIAETILGAIVAAIAIGFFVFAAAQAGQGAAAGGGADYIANFQRVDGVNVGSDVRISGVKVGVVKAIALNPDTYQARVTLNVQGDVTLLDQTTARVASDGLLGGAYIGLEPAGLDPLPPGGEIFNTQGSVDLLTLLTSAAQNMGGGSSAETAP